MRYCSNCGKSIDPIDKFCSECGTKIGSISSMRREQVFEGNIHKCPNCGEVIGAFSKNCPSCGFEFRNVQASSTVQELSRQLHEIESKRENAYYDPDTDRKRVDLISHFPVPNTKEDILEFMILACSNIDEEQYFQSFEVNAWKSMMEQAYQKAKLLWKEDDDDFRKIQELYAETNNVYDNAKLKQALIVIGFIVCLFLFLFLGIILPD